MAKTVRLKVMAYYRARDVRYIVGQELELSETDARQLLDDAPGCFKIIEPVVMEITVAPADKMQRKVRIK